MDHGKIGTHQFKIPVKPQVNFELYKKHVMSTLCHSKDLNRVKAGFKSVPLQPFFEFPATFWHWIAQQFQNIIGE